MDLHGRTRSLLLTGLALLLVLQAQVSPAGASGSASPGVQLLLEGPRSVTYVPNEGLDAYKRESIPFVIEADVAVGGWLSITVHSSSICTTASTLDDLAVVLTTDSDDEKRREITHDLSYPGWAPGTYYWRIKYERYNPSRFVDSGCVPVLHVLPADEPPAPPLPADPWFPFKSWDALVTGMFNDFTGKAPSEQDVREWRTLLSTKRADVGDLSAALRVTSDHRDNVDPVVRLYRAYFLRNPDASGLTYWIDERRERRSLRSISEFFASSAEFRNRYGALPDTGFVDLIYRNVLERPGDGSGHRFWVEELSSGRRTRGDLMTGFSESAEYVSKNRHRSDVIAMYISMLKRMPTAAEFISTVSRLEDARLSRSGLGSELARSSEFTDRIQSQD